MQAWQWSSRDYSSCSLFQADTPWHILYVDFYKTNLYQHPGLVPTSEDGTGKRWPRLPMLWCWDCPVGEAVPCQVQHCGVKQLTEFLFDRN